MQNLYLIIALSPLISSMIVGLLGCYLGKSLSHWIAILGVLVSTTLSLLVFNNHIFEGYGVFNQNIYTWASIGSISLSIGFLVDNLTATMMVVVSFISLMVHIYTIGYMKDDPGYTRFFSYISLFTFAMLMLVMSNNFLQLFFGWEAVGLVSYLLIGFWFKKESAIFANLKAFLVNRVGDFGFLLGIGLIFMYFSSLDYYEVFNHRSLIVDETLFGGISLITVICILLFVGAMGKSAQIPLHVWLPDSMEGPTPISALIHAATMVTAGIFMVARMSPLFEMSDIALTFVMVIGAITALFMGILGIIQNDIKRIIAYSTLSQLGYMTVALGVSAYSVAIFHLVTHAFFKALLFLAAGSVIIAMHHKQDIREMGGIWYKMPITYITSLIGTLALIGFPGFAGFYSKDMIIEAVHLSNLPYANWVYFAVIIGVFITAFYSMRLLFLVFHGKPRMGEHTKSHIKETPYVVTIPLMLLAIPSVIIGFALIEPMLFGNFFMEPIFSNSIFVNNSHLAMTNLTSHFESAFQLLTHAVYTPPFWMMVIGIISAWIFTLKKPQWADVLKNKLSLIHNILENKYGFDKLYELVFATGSRRLGEFLFKVSDYSFIDTFIVNGSAKVVMFFSSFAKTIQNGHIYFYVFFMITSLLLILSWLLFIGNEPLISLNSF